MFLDLSSDLPENILVCRWNTIFWVPDMQMGDCTSGFMNCKNFINELLGV